MSLVSFYCVMFALIKATLLNEYESSYFQFLSNCLFSIMPGENFRESSFTAIMTAQLFLNETAMSLDKQRVRGTSYSPSSLQGMTESRKI